nr:hypothetical protein [Tanacetum cinerariifolium]
MHVHTFELTSEELKTIIKEYCIPMDLDPRLPPPGMTMDRLPSRYIGLYVEQLKQRGEVARMSEFLVPLRPPPRHLLYVCGLTTACRHPELSYDIKNQVMNGTAVSIGDPIPKEQHPKPRVTPLSIGTKLSELTAAQKNLEKPNAKITATREKKEQQNLVKARVKRAVSGVSKFTQIPLTMAMRVDWWQTNAFLGSLSNAEVICRAYQTLRQSVVAQRELLKRHEELNRHYVDLRNRNDDQLEELDQLRPSLRRKTQENEDLNQRLTLLDSVHSECPSREKELLDKVKDLERERDEWRETISDQVEKIRSLEKDLEPRTQQLAAAEEKIKVLKGEKLNILGKAAQSEADRKKLVREWLGGLSLGRTEDQIAQFLSETQDLDIEGSKSWESKHRELFTMSYPYVQKVSNSCDLPMNELLAVCPDVPPPATEGPTFGDFQ